MCVEPEVDIDVCLFCCQPVFLWDRVSSLRVEFSYWTRVAGIYLSPIFLPPLSLELFALVMGMQILFFLLARQALYPLSPHLIPGLIDSLFHLYYLRVHVVSLTYSQGHCDTADKWNKRMIIWILKCGVVFAHVWAYIYVCSCLRCTWGYQKLTLISSWLFCFI